MVPIYVTSCQTDWKYQIRHKIYPLHPSLSSNNAVYIPIRVQLAHTVTYTVRPTLRTTSTYTVLYAGHGPLSWIECAPILVGILILRLLGIGIWSLAWAMLVSFGRDWSVYQSVYQFGRRLIWCRFRHLNPCRLYIYAATYSPPAFFSPEPT